MRGVTLLGLLPPLLLVELCYTQMHDTATVAPPVNAIWRSCMAEREERPGMYVPQCDDEGRFRPQQCFGSSGYCWCVNINTGEEIAGTRTPPGTLPVMCGSDREPYTGDYCPPGWMRHGTRCFIFVQQPSSWIQAQSYCMFVGGSLASVHSMEEDHFLQGLTMDAKPPFPHTWIGANDCIQMGAWMWSDGSMFDYYNFPPRPMTQTNGTCAQMNYGVWRAWMQSSCDDLHPFICAKHI